MIRLKQNRWILFGLAVVLVLLPELMFRFGYFQVNEKTHARELEEFIQQKIEKNETVLNQILQDSSAIQSQTSSGTSYFLLQDKNLIAWSNNNNAVPDKTIILQSINTPTLSVTANGSELILAKKLNGQIAVSSTIIQRNFKFNSNYLPSRFHTDLHLHENYTLSTSPSKEYPSEKIQINNATQIYLVNNNPNELHYEGHGYYIIFQALGLVLLFVSLTRFFFIWSHRHPYLSTSTYIVFLVGLKMLLSFYPVLTLLHQSDVFNPEVFASGSFDPSLGDFLLSFLLLFFGVFLLYKNYFLFLQGIKSRFIFYVTISNIILIFTLYSLLNGLQNLVLNSQIDFFFKNIRSINEYTIIGIGGLGLGLFATLFLLSRLRYFYTHYTTCLRYILLMHAIGLAICYFIFHLDIIEMQAVLSLLCLIYIAWPEKKALSAMNATSAVLMVFSLIAANEFYHSTTIKEKNERSLLAEKIADSQDPDMETDVSEILQRLSNDTLLADCITGRKSLAQDSIEIYLDNKYFDKILKDFKINYYLLANDSTVIYPFNSRQEIPKEHLKMTALSGKMTGSRYLYYIYNKAKGIDYLASVPLSLTPYEAKINIEFVSKKIPQRPGFEELLTHNNSFYSKLLSEYSHIKYVNNNIVEQRGNFLYKNNGATYAKYNKKTQFFTEEGFDHLLFRPGANSFIIISKPFTSWLTHVTSFSYILILFALEFILISVLLYRKKIGKGVFTISTKIQVAFVILTILAMTLFGITTEYTVSKQYTSKNKNLVAEKLESIRTEIAGKIQNVDTDNQQKTKSVLGQVLLKFAKVFNVDINFYTVNGELLATSIPEVYRNHIMGSMMNSSALNRLRNENMPRYIQEESIGNLNFFGGYLSFYKNNEHIGYIYIPYFARQNEINNEFSSLLMAIINISVVLFAFTIVLSVIITQIIISPLNKIRESIAKIQLNKVNKPIVYKGKDELADLVKEYNNKVAELEKFTYYLAQTERETAWREMAKQVAHEIKNPLTPMRLNIQHMQRSLQKDDPDFNEKLQRISSSLLEQIDALTTIASEFSSLAKMPGVKFEEIDYHHLLEGIIELYNDDERIKISLNAPAGKIPIHGDKEQLLRVLNNLVKNAQQAIPEEQEGRIEINVDISNGNVKTAVKDNGSGINAEWREKIFTPNFTTKTTGSGLGLMMVKNIIEQHKGKIWFESSTSGTTFFFELPLSTLTENKK